MKIPQNKFIISFDAFYSSKHIIIRLLGGEGGNGKLCQLQIAPEFVTYLDIFLTYHTFLNVTLIIRRYYVCQWQLASVLSRSTSQTACGLNGRAAPLTLY